MNHYCPVCNCTRQFKFTGKEETIGKRVYYEAECTTCKRIILVYAKRAEEKK